MKVSVDGGMEAPLGDWIVRQSLGAGTAQSLVEGMCERLCAAGIPLLRFYLAMPTVSPDIRAAAISWDRKAGYEGEGIRHDSGPDEFTVSPFRPMVDERVNFRRWRLDGPHDTGYSVLDRLRREGAVEYLAYLVRYDETGTRALRGAAISFASDAPDGFRPDDVALLTRLVPLLGLAALRFATSHILSDMLGCYVGRDAGERILRGEIRRGEGHTLHAAIMFADLRGFTAMTETGGKDVVPRLGEHLSAMAEPVEEAGGEVLKILGDGLLATFPIEDDQSGKACQAALRAARDALVRNAQANERHPDLPPLLLDIALHRGEVFYGNIGAGRRLDFTVIGPAVNEASRIEALCGVLDRPILMSEPFASCCGAQVASLGRHKLRGVAAERELFGLA